METILITVYKYAKMFHVDQQEIIRRVCEKCGISEISQISFYNCEWNIQEEIEAGILEIVTAIILDTPATMGALR